MNNVVLVQSFEVPDRAASVFLERWEAVATFLRQPPGFVGARIHEHVPHDGSRYLELVEWDSVASFLAAAVAAEVSDVTPAVGPRSAELYREATSMGTAPAAVALHVAA